MSPKISPPEGRATTATDIQTLYSGKLRLRAIAVDESVIAMEMGGDDLWASSYPNVSIVTCQLSDCMGTLRTIYNVPDFQCPPGGPTRSLPMTCEIALHGGEVYWSEWSSSLGGRVVACSTSGCSNSPRVVFSRWMDRLAFRGDTIFGLNFTRGFASGSSSEENLPEWHGHNSSAVAELADAVPYASEVAMAYSAEADAVFVKTRHTIEKFPADLRDAQVTFYHAEDGIRDMVVTGPDVLFIDDWKQVRRCPVEGCPEVAELLVQSREGPIVLAADEQQLAWLEYVRTADGGLSDWIALLGTTFADRKRDVKIYSNSVISPKASGCGLHLNSRYFFWCEDSPPECDNGTCMLTPEAFWSRVRMISR